MLFQVEASDEATTSSRAGAKVPKSSIVDVKETGAEPDEKEIVKPTRGRRGECSAQGRFETSNAHLWTLTKSTQRVYTSSPRQELADTISTPEVSGNKRRPHTQHKADTMNLQQ